MLAAQFASYKLGRIMLDTTLPSATVYEDDQMLSSLFSETSSKQYACFENYLFEI